MDNEESSMNRRALTEDFHCAKCRSRKAYTSEIEFAKGVLADLLPLKQGKRYAVLTCSLCGYSEFYDMAILAHLPATQRAEKPVVEDVGQEA